MINIFYNYFDKNKDKLINKIELNNELINVQNSITEFLKDMYYELSNNSNSDTKPYISVVINSLIKATSIIISVDDVKLLKKENINKKTSASALLTKYLATIISVAFAIYFFIDGKLTPMISAVLLGFVSLIIQTIKNESKKNDSYQYIFLANTNKIINTLGEYFSNADNELAMFLAKKSNENNSISWDSNELYSIQMLYEAIVQKDGDYSLKAANQLINSLQNRNINFETYSDKNKAYFDLFPGIEDSYTIRPALLYEGKLILKGQATVKQVSNNGW